MSYDFQSYWNLSKRTLAFPVETVKNIISGNVKLTVRKARQNEENLFDFILINSVTIILNWF